MNAIFSEKIISIDFNIKSKINNFKIDNISKKNITR